MSNIKKGERITVDCKLMNSGREYIYKTTLPAEIELRRRGTCKCEPCKQRWPHMLEMCNPLNVFLPEFYRCNCGNVITGSADFIWCNRCLKIIHMNKYDVHQMVSYII